jgi:hypothetical protein
MEIKYKWLIAIKQKWLMGVEHKLIYTDDQK